MSPKPLVSNRLVMVSTATGITTLVSTGIATSVSTGITTV